MRTAMRRSKVYRLMTVLVALALTFPGSAFALPAGHHVEHGDAAVQYGDKSVTIDQASDRLILNWNEFGIAGDENVTFNQPGSSSVALNRVLGDNLSVIDGQLNANEHVFLINPQSLP